MTQIREQVASPTLALGRLGACGARKLLCTMPPYQREWDTNHPLDLAVQPEVPTPHHESFQNAVAKSVRKV